MTDAEKRVLAAKLREVGEHFRDMMEDPRENWVENPDIEVAIIEEAAAEIERTIGKPA